MIPKQTTAGKTIATNSRSSRDPGAVTDIQKASERHPGLLLATINIILN